MNMRKLILAAASAAIALTAQPAAAADKSSGRKAQEKGVAEIPVCSRKLGTIAIVEPDNNWWQGLGLGSPEAVLKLFVREEYGGLFCSQAECIKGQVSLASTQQGPIFKGKSKNERQKNTGPLSLCKTRQKEGKGQKDKKEAKKEIKNEQKEPATSSALWPHNGGRKASKHQEGGAGAGDQWGGRRGAGGLPTPIRLQSLGFVRAGRGSGWSGGCRLGGFC
jgi:hypothetical protein